VTRFIEQGKSTGLALDVDFTVPDTGDGNVVAPVVFVDQPEDAAVMREKIFGPVVCINTFATEDEVLAKANDSEYGLYAAVYTKDVDRAMRFARSLESGQVGVNCTSRTGSWDMPFGGCKQSGIGREGFHDSMDDWLETNSVYIKVAGLQQACGGHAELGR